MDMMEEPQRMAALAHAHARTISEQRARVGH